MDVRIALRPADEVRAVIAQAYLSCQRIPDKVGNVQLRPHQVDAVRRLHVLLERCGGALLGDEVGLGKTYTALALAASSATNALVVAPASLLPMWKRSAEVAALECLAFISHEALSRQRAPIGDFDFMIVDEAHHARNPATRRYAELAKLCIRAHVLLVSATPIHNSERDLRALFALFMGGHAWSCDIDELTALIVRRRQSGVGIRNMPVALPPKWLELPHSDALLADILALPPPLPPSDGGDAGALVLHGLLRQWTSSDAAFLKALRRRRARAVALIAALEAGRYPTRQELRSWSYDGDAVQLAFPGLVAGPVASPDSLLESVRAHDEAVGALVARAAATTTSDKPRAEHLLRLRARHPDARIVAFTQFADTALGLFRLVAPRGGAAALTARGALTAGGTLTRAEALTRFNSAIAPLAERISLLLTTDLLSEGIDLPEVSVVVHLDLPWTPARLEQRVGRALRLNSRYREVHVYCMSPPASAEALLRVEQLLRRKLGDAVRTMGVAGAILPSIVPTEVMTRRPSVPAAEERIREVLATWRRNAQTSTDAPCCARINAPIAGWLALMDDGQRSRLIACSANDVTEDVADIAHVVEQSGGVDAARNEASVAEVQQRIEDWLRYRRAAVDAGVTMTPASRSGPRLLQRIRTIASRAPLHRRRQIIALAREAREAVLARRGIASERQLAELVDSELADEPWLKAVGSFARETEPPQTEPRSYRIRALLLLCAP